MDTLKKNKFSVRKGPVILAIMDGVGLAQDNDGNAVYLSRTPNLNYLRKNFLNTSLKAHGTAVGLPSDEDMGNSEVGHNALGAGRIFDQGAKLVDRAIASGDIYKSPTWNDVLENPKNKGTTLHFLGLLSDGNVHSHINHLLMMLTKCSQEGVKKVRVHILLDGRDVSETSGLIYVNQLEEHLKSINANGFDYRIASGGGRMITTMDRYEADWSIVERGWQAHILGTARKFKSATEAIETYRTETPGLTDQYLHSFTIADEKGPIGSVEDGDSVIFFNFRGDRSIEISRAFDDIEFTKFDRVRVPKVTYAGMMEYDGDLHIPKKYLVFPPAINETVSEYLANAGAKQFAISETQKFGHVTYFWNGNKSGKFNDATETYQEITSDKIAFDHKPWMKAVEITDSMIEAIESKKYDFLRLNWANGDMVGHTGNLEAAVIAMETVDMVLGQLVEAVKKVNGVLLVTADHGNLDEMYEIDKKGNFIIDKKTGVLAKKTSHTLNRVPFIIYDPSFQDDYKLTELAEEERGLANVAATILSFMGYEAPANYNKSLVTLK